MAPWRILEQAITVLTPDKEPGFTMQFSINAANSAECRLRIVTPDMDADALEITFTTGGLMTEQVYQPRILKPFARGPIVVPPEPEERPIGKNNEMVLVNPLTNRTETDDERERREKLAALKEKREPTDATEAKPGGPDSTSPNTPEAQAAQSVRSGIDETSGTGEKGMASQQAGGQAGENAKTARLDQENATNAVDQELQRQDKAPNPPVDNAAPKGKNK